MRIRELVGNAAGLFPNLRRLELFSVGLALLGSSRREQ
jgi:hypothetical protein